MKPNNRSRGRIAYFITAHGLGHASRSCGVMEAILEKNPQIQFEIYSETPKWFFTDSLHVDVDYHSVKTDIGMVQLSPFQGDLAATIDQLRQFLPFNSRTIAEIANTVRQRHCDLILCDIAPLGIAVAAEAGIPSVLIENFTWDWIYSHYRFEQKELTPYIDWLEKLYQSAAYHVKTEPLCQPGKADLTVGPISRKPRTQAAAIRTQLGLDIEEKVVIVTMGGIRDHKDYAPYLENHSGIHFLIPGGDDKLIRRGNLTFLPYRSDFFHPDLINASDVVIGKAGYSTIAEVYQSGKPFGYVCRPRFPEIACLVDFINKHLRGLPIPIEALSDQRWLQKIPRLIDFPKNNRKKKNGADQVADFILELLSIEQ